MAANLSIAEATRQGNGIMLVLTRKRDQSIVIGRNVVITIVECADKVVRLGITAPRDVPVYRQEIFDRLMEEKGRSTVDQGCPVRSEPTASDAP